MPQGGARGQNLGHLKKSFFFAFIFLLCNQYIFKEQVLFRVDFLPAVQDSPPFRGRGIPFYLSQFVSILGNLYPDRGVKGSFMGMFGKMDLCKKILIQAYTSLI